jgi:hypothetical protein
MHLVLTPLEIFCVFSFFSKPHIDFILQSFLDHSSPYFCRLPCCCQHSSMAPLWMPPLFPYGTLSGELFLYASNRAAFESSCPQCDAHSSCPNRCILLGGLSDGLLCTPYTQKLEHACAHANWSLVQPLLSSSYLVFGHGRLELDTKELEELVAYLKAHQKAERGFLFLSGFLIIIPSLSVFT